MIQPRNSLLTIRRLVLMLFALCAFPFAVHAQSATATLSGTVEDQNKGLVPGARVKAINLATGLERDTETNESGSFSIPLLPPSSYTVRVERDGFVTIEVSGVVLNVGDARALRIQMKVGDVKEVVNVTGEASLVNESPAVGTVVDRQFVANIPLNGRSFQSLIALTPGVVITPAANSTQGQFSVNGQRAGANYFTVDGVSANFAVSPGFGLSASASGSLPSVTTFGTTQGLVSVDALQEFKVQTSTYTAEYGRQPGGQVSIVTRSGTNEFHGSLFDYLRNDVLDANDWFANANGQPKAPERQNDFGGTFSGPVMLPRFGEGGHQPGYNGRNRTFFFFSYEGLQLRLPQFTLTNVPTLTLRETAPAAWRPVLKAFPPPNGKDLGNGLAEFTASYSNPSSLSATSLRIDHTINQRWTLFGRYNTAPSQTTSRSVSNLSRFTRNEIKTQTFTVGLTATLTPHAVNEFKFNYSNNDATQFISHNSLYGAVPPPRSALIPPEYDSDTAQGQITLLFAGRTSVGNVQVGIFGGEFSYPQRQINLIENFSYSLSNHQFKFGIDYRHLTPSFAANTYSLSAVLANQTQIFSSTIGTVSVLSISPAKFRFINFSAYGQDSWKLSRRLTIDLGLRWDVNPAPKEVTGRNPLAVTSIDNLATMQLAPNGTSLWGTTHNNFAPRVGVAYRLWGDSANETVIRGGFGVFFDTGNNQGANGSFGYPFVLSRVLSNVPYPFLAAQLAPAAVANLSNLTPPYGTITVFDPQLKLPYTLQWNVAIQHSLGNNQAVSVSYVGAAGRRLLQQRQLSLSAINPKFTTVNLTTNQATSDYHALQAQFQRRLSRGLQVLASYTWSHALDNDSADLGTIIPVRGNAAFDIRHVFSSAITYDVPVRTKVRVLNAILRNWSLDSTFRAQTGLPIDVIASNVVNPADGTLVGNRPVLMSGIPLYLYGPQYPGGRIINNTIPTAAQVAAAGCAPLTATNAKGALCTPLPGKFGNLGRNVLRGFGAWQLDFALRRQIKLTEKLDLQFRAEAFNIFNHPNFGTIQTNLTAANFGQATNMLNRHLGGLNPLYQLGGPRSMQFAVKFVF